MAGPPIQHRLKRYGELVRQKELTDEEILQLASAIAFLWLKGLLRDEQRLRRIRNRALRQVSNGAAPRALDELVKSLPASKGAQPT